MNVEIANEEAARLCRLAADGDEAAFETLYTLTLPLLKECINKFNIPGMDSEDVSQELALCLRYNIIPGYDPTRGAFGGMVRIVFHGRASDLLIRATKTRKGIALRRLRSLDAPIDDEGGVVGLLLEDGATKLPDARLVEVEAVVETQGKLELIMKSLTDFECAVLLLYVETMSVKVVAQKLRSGVRGMLPRRNLSEEEAYRSVDNAVGRIRRKATEIAKTENWDAWGNAWGA